MIRRSRSLIVLSSFLCLLWFSCSDDGLIGEPQELKTADDVTVGEVHNAFVHAYLDRCPRRSFLTRDERIQAYVEVAKVVCEKQNYDYAPSQARMDGFLDMAEQWREADIWDIFNPSTVSPVDALDRFVTAGVIPAEHAPYLHRLLEGLQRQDIEPRGPLAFAIAPCAEMELARDLLQSSCQLWYDWDGTRAFPIEFADDPELAADWWKTVVKYFGVGACDGLAGWAAGFAFAGNPFAIGFFAGIASVAAYDAFDERGW